MTTTEKYIYQIYLEKSFSKAAKTLFVSQPSLSASVAHKEKELGFQIFDRSTKPISLTPQGHIYLDMLEEMRECEKNMRLRVQKLTSSKHESIGIGASSGCAYYMIPSICGAFYRRHPETEVKIDLGNFGAESSLIERLTHFQKLDTGDLDIVFGYNYDPNKYLAEVIYNERLVVAMRNELVTDELLPYAVTHKELLSETYTQDKEIRQANLFSSIPFLDFSKSVSTGQYMTKLLNEYTESAHKISNGRHSIVHFNMMRAGVGAVLTSDYMVALSGADNDLRYFVFPRDISTRKIYMISNKNAPLNPSAKKFTDVAKLVCGSGKALDIYNNAQ